MDPKNDAEALRDYMEAHKKYNDLLYEYYHPVNVVTGNETVPGKSISIEIMNELDELARDVENKREVWMNFLRQRPK